MEGLTRELEVGFDPSRGLRNILWSWGVVMAVLNNESGQWIDSTTIKLAAVVIVVHLSQT